MTAKLTHTLSIGDFDYQMTQEVYDVAHPLLLANDDRVFVPIHKGQRAGQVTPGCLRPRRPIQQSTEETQ